MRLRDRAVSRFSLIDGVNSCPDFSPDGRLLAYANEYQGSASVVVEEYEPEFDKRTRLTFSGREPRWSADGRELFFRYGTAFNSVEVTRDPVLALGPQERLFDNGQRYEPGYQVSAYDVMPDGRHFLMSVRVAPPRSPATRVNIVLGWRGRLEPTASPQPGNVD
jgi:hypothetical protein